MNILKEYNDIIIICKTVNFLSLQGITLLMMGSVGELPQAPAQKTVFVEDMTDAQLASAVSAVSFYKKIYSF